MTFKIDESRTAGACTISAGTVKFKNVPGGNCVIDANQAGNATYLTAPRQTLTIVIR